jgi:hypothetical protein
MFENPGIAQVGGKSIPIVVTVYDEWNRNATSGVEVRFWIDTYDSSDAIEYGAAIEPTTVYTVGNVAQTTFTPPGIHYYDNPYGKMFWVHVVAEAGRPSSADELPWQVGYRVGISEPSTETNGQTQDQTGEPTVIGPNDQTQNQTSTDSGSIIPAIDPTTVVIVIAIIICVILVLAIGKRSRSKPLKDARQGGQ